MVNLLIVIIFLFIPSNLLSLYIALAVQKCYPHWTRVFPFAVGLGLSMGIARAIAFGFHPVIIGLLFMVAVKQLGKGRWSWAVLGALLVQVSEAVGEGLLVVPLAAQLGIPLDHVLATPLYHVAAGWIANSLLLVVGLYLIVRHRRKKEGSAHEGA